MSIVQKRILIEVLSVVAVLLIAGIAALIILLPAKGEVSNEFWLSTDTYRLEDTQVIQKEQGKDFKILNLADIQYSDVKDIGKRSYTEETIKTLIEQEKPDLILMTGDQTWTATQRSSIKSLIKFMDSFKIPWAPVFGNHDGEGNADKNWLADRYEESEYCLFKKGPNNIGGVGNYIINIMEGDKIVESIIMMDSGVWRNYPDESEHFMYSDALKDDYEGEEKSKNYKEYKLNDDGTRQQAQYGTGYEFIAESQIAWYKWAIEGAAKINGGTAPESTAVFHIALPEYHEAYLQWLDSGFNPDMGFGEMREQVCCPKINSGLFDVMKELGSTKNVLVGHDHINTFSVMYEGIRLTYGLKTGDRCYINDDLNGGTVLTLTDKGITNVEHKFVEVKD